LDFSTNTAASGNYLSVSGASGYAAGCRLEGIVINGNSSAGGAVGGLYVGNIKSLSLSHISVSNTKGPGIKVGFSYLVSMNDVQAVGTGSAGYCEIEANGNSGTSATLGTTLFIKKVNIEKGTASPDCGLSINAFYIVSVDGGVIESMANAIWLENNSTNAYVVKNVKLSNLDMESISTTCVRAGYGWTGAAGYGIYGLELDNVNCTGTGSPLIDVTNTQSFSETNSTIYSSTASAIDHLFFGTNLQAKINPAADPYHVGSSSNIWVKVGSTNSLSANPYSTWCLSGGCSRTGGANTSTTATTLYPGIDYPVQNFTGALTGDLPVTLSTTNAMNDTGFILMNNTTGGHNITSGGASAAAGAALICHYIGAGYACTQ